MTEYSATVCIPVIRGSANIILNGEERLILKDDEIIVSYKFSANRRFRWLFKNIKVSVADVRIENPMVSSLRNASIE